MIKIKMVRLHLPTYDRFIKLGKYGDTADTILKRLIDCYEKHGDK